MASAALNNKLHAGYTSITSTTISCRPNCFLPSANVCVNFWIISLLIWCNWHWFSWFIHVWKCPSDSTTKLQDTCNEVSRQCGDLWDTQWLFSAPSSSHFFVQLFESTCVDDNATFGLTLPVFTRGETLRRGHVISWDLEAFCSHSSRPSAWTLASSLIDTIQDKTSGKTFQNKTRTDQLHER